MVVPAMPDGTWRPCGQISKKYTHYAAILLFVGFGLRSLYDAATESGVRPRPPLLLVLSLFYIRYAIPLFYSS
jgi:hypothetical protein